MLAVDGVAAGLGGLVGLLVLVFLVWCAVATLRKGQILLFVLGFFCGFCWIIGYVFAADKRHEPPGLGSGHYVPPTPGT